MLSFSLVAEALTGLIYHRPSGKNSSFVVVHTCLMMGEASLETSPKNNMIQDMISINLSVFEMSILLTGMTIDIKLINYTACGLCGSAKLLKGPQEKT